MEKQTPPTKKREGELNFTAVTDGLGFHPFSDGLPYAPVVKTAQSKPRMDGAGAVSAGPATFVRPSMPVQRPADLNPSPKTARVSVPIASPAIAQSTAAAKPSTDSATSVIPEARFGFVYLIKRMFAYTLDTALNTGLCAAAMGAVLWYQKVNFEAMMSPAILLVCSLFLVMFNWALITAQEIAFGTSVGKRIFGLGIIGNASAIFLRSFFFLPSLGFCGLGLLWALIDRRRRCWHDVVVDLQPIEIGRL